MSHTVRERYDNVKYRGMKGAIGTTNGASRNRIARTHRSVQLRIDDT